MASCRRQKDGCRDSVSITLREQCAGILVVEPKEIGQRKIDVLAVLCAAQGRLKVRPATNKAAKEVLTARLNIRDARIGKRSFRGSKSLCRSRDKGFPAIELCKFFPLGLEKRQVALVFAHGVAEILSRTQCTCDLHQGWRQSGLEFGYLFT